MKHLENGQGIKMTTTHAAIKQCILEAKRNNSLWADMALAELEVITKIPQDFATIQPNPIGWQFAND